MIAFWAEKRSADERARSPNARHSSNHPQVPDATRGMLSVPYKFKEDRRKYKRDSIRRKCLLLKVERKLGLTLDVLTRMIESRQRNLSL